MTNYLGSRRLKSEVAGLISQWQSDVGVTTSGSEVTAVADQVNSNNLAKIDATGPTLITGAVNGFPGIKSAGSVTRLSHAIAQLNGSANYSLVLVVTPYDTSNFVTALMMTYADGVGPQLSLGTGGSGWRVGGFFDGVFPVTNAILRGNDLVNTFDILVATRAGSVVTYYKNGAPLTPTVTRSGAAVPLPFIYLNGDRVGNTARGTWAQARVYDHALTAADVLAVSQSLGAKYNIPVQGVAGTALNRAGWTVVAYHDDGGTFAAAKAIDNNVSTRWGSVALVTPNVSDYKIDLGSAQMVGGFFADNFPENGGGWAQAKAGNVQCSDDNATWTTVASWITGVGMGQASWTPVSHRYWRLLATDVSQDGGWWSIGELNLYSDRAP